MPDPAPPAAEALVSESGVSRAVIAQAARVAATSMPVLLTGETGTGKEIMARVIHAWSPRRQKQFVPINCAAIPNELMEAELFGYARGAFSGAVQRYDGQLMAAAGGTVFLDEIDDTPLETQVKLLRVLEDRVVSRLGENTWHEVDFRLLAATNRDLRPLIEAGLFGADLYERLAIVTIHLAPLRERLDDLPALARHFMARFAREQGREPVLDIRADALRALGGLPVAGQHPRAAQRDLPDAGLQARGPRDPAVRSAARAFCAPRAASAGDDRRGSRVGVAQDRAWHDEPARRGRGAGAAGARRGARPHRRQRGARRAAARRRRTRRRARSRRHGQGDDAPAQDPPLITHALDPSGRRQTG